MSPIIKISVIVPCYNAANTIAVQLEALDHRTYSEPFEIIAVDSGSIDDTSAILKHYQQKIPHLQVVEASARQGALETLEVH